LALCDADDVAANLPTGRRFARDKRAIRDGAVIDFETVDRTIDQDHPCLLRTGTGIRRRAPFQIPDDDVLATAGDLEELRLARGGSDGRAAPIDDDLTAAHDIDVRRDRIRAAFLERDRAASFLRRHRDGGSYRRPVV